MFFDTILRCLLLLSLLLSCAMKTSAQKKNSGTDQSLSQKTTLFKLLSPSETGIHFANTLTESDSLNILNQANIYNGGGVGVADFNNDGLVDIFLAGNMVSNKLYINKGEMVFEDITSVAGVGGQGRWCTGVSAVDINADGWMDIYVSASFRNAAQGRKNLLYIHQGLNKKGIPVFKESGDAYGLGDTGFSTQGIFFDYDLDGDLDLYLVVNELNDPKTPIQYRPKVVDGTARNTDKLFRNNGNGSFTNVSAQAGILIEGWGHAAAVSDFNMDGWPDIYVSNDFISNDLLYINNRNGTFTNRLEEYLKHSAWNSMGADVVDINNDGFADLVALEMLPEDNMRKKTMLSGNEYFNYFNSRRFDYQHQYVRNMFQLNAGMTPEGHPVFSDVGYMAGVFETDWSWAPLVADFDNDGFRDIIITNGLPRDVTDLDYIVYNSGQGGTSGKEIKATLSMVDSLPVVKISNYAFRNSGGFLFENTSDAWGVSHKSFSNGAAYADLDNDADLDFIINNINDPAFVYENTLNGKDKRERKNNSLTVVLKGDGKNVQGIGAVVRIYYAGNKQQLYEHQPCRGYLATVDARAHFGLGGAETVDSLRVRWPDGRTELLTKVKANQVTTLHHRDAKGFARSLRPKPQTALLKETSENYGIRFLHPERDAIDYNIQATLPHKLSQYGPGIATGDIDNNGYDDFYIGGSATYPGVFFMQDKSGRFTKDTNRFLSAGDFGEEEMGVLLFDADNDSDLDLYTVSGSYEFKPNHPASQDRLYLNNGKGNFTVNDNALPKMLSNGSCVRAADFDADGDLDLFVGGRVLSGAYPLAPRSYLLRNDGGTFVDVTAEYSRELMYLGMVTDALWTDFDQDGKADLVVVGEWMPVTFLKNTGGAFIPMNETGISQHVGWWNSLVSGDFDNDGDVDYVAGNLGLNSNYKASLDEPMSVYAKDLNQDRRLDAMLFCYMNAEDGSRKPFPMHTRDDMITQLVSIRRQYPTYESFGRASLDELWSEDDRINAITMSANTLATSFIENKGNGKFALRPLPPEAQAAPVYGMVSRDLDQDGNLDLLLVGNDYGMQPFSGRHDALNGLCLKGDGSGNFLPLAIAESGFFVKGDAKGLALIHTARSEDIVVATQNQDSVKVHSEASFSEKDHKWVKLNGNDFYADVLYKGNRKRRVEFYYGGTYLSQSSRWLSVGKDVESVVITDFQGGKREVDK
jgi:enediyne biosynthesis protein E4